MKRDTLGTTRIENMMASATINALLVKAFPDKDLDVLLMMGTLVPLDEAYSAGRITATEGRQLQDYLAKRSAARNARLDALHEHDHGQWQGDDD